MARTVVTYTGSGPATLMATVNAQLALLPGILLRGVQLCAPGDIRYLSNQVWAVIVTYDTGGSGTSPYQVLISSATEEALAAAASQAFITLNSTYFFAPVVLSAWTGGGRGTPKFFSLLVYNVSQATGSANYADIGPGTGSENVFGLAYTQAANTAATTITGLNFAVGVFQGLIIDYVATRGAGVSKTGTLTVNGDATSPAITDSTQGAVTGAPGLTWTTTVATGIVSVKLAVDNSTGTAVALRFQVHQLVSP